MVDMQALRVIEQADPAGWESVEPTPVDVAKHKTWAIDLYGQATWNRYTGRSTDGSELDSPANHWGLFGTEPG